MIWEWGVMKTKNRKMVYFLTLGGTLCSLGLLGVILFANANPEATKLIFFGTVENGDKAIVLSTFYNLLWFMMGNFWLLQNVYRYKMEIKHIFIANFIIAVELVAFMGIYYFFEIVIMPGMLLVIGPSIYLFIVRITDKTGKYNEDFTGKEHLILHKRKED